MPKRDLPYSHQFVDEDDIRAVVDVLRSGWLTQGPVTLQFEQAVADRVGAKHAVAVNSATAALHIACLAAGIGKGDTVVTSPNTFVASANCALYVGATPQFSDIDPQTLNLDPEKLALRCSELGRVKAIIPVHFAGLPCDMAAVRKISQSAGATVIEDAAHALGAAYAEGGFVGNCANADMTVFSFHPVKMITTGEGGMVTTNDEHLYRRLLRLRSHGINKLDDKLLNAGNAYTGDEVNAWYYEMQEIGFNFRMTDIQASLGLSQLSKLGKFIDRRRALARQYDAIWKDDPYVRPAQPGDRDRNSLHLYVVRIAFDKAGILRNKFILALRNLGIFAQVHYIPVHLHPYYESLGFEPGQFPCTEEYYRECLSIPLYYGLTDEEQAFVVRSMRELLS